MVEVVAQRRSHFAHGAGVKEIDHRAVVRHDVGGEPADALLPADADQLAEQVLAEALSLPVVADDERDLGGAGGRIDGVAGHGDDPLRLLIRPVLALDRDQRQLLGIIQRDETPQLRGRQASERMHEAVHHRLGGQRIEEILEHLGVARLDRADVQPAAVLQRVIAFVVIQLRRSGPDGDPLLARDQVAAMRLLHQFLGFTGPAWAYLEQVARFLDRAAVALRRLSLPPEGRPPGPGAAELTDAFNEVARQAIESDPEFAGGHYLVRNTQPAKGLALARMIGHITYLSDESMRQKFGRRLRQKERYGYDFSLDFEVESYLRYQGEAFVQRFDANSYLYITKAIDYFDLKRDYGSLEEAFSRVTAQVLVFSFNSDWLFPTYQNQEIVRALKVHRKPVSFVEFNSPYGHDSFLIENPQQEKLVADFIAHVYDQESHS